MLIDSHVEADRQEDLRQMGVIRLAVWGSPEDLRAHAAGRLGKVEDVTAEVLSLFGIKESEA